MVIPGAMAISIYTGIENPDMVYPTVVLNALPKGLIGLVLAGTHFSNYVKCRFQSSKFIFNACCC